MAKQRESGDREYANQERSSSKASSGGTHQGSTQPSNDSADQSWSDCEGCESCSDE